MTDIKEVLTPRAQVALDEEHLRLLTIAHYVIGGLIVLVSCFGLIHTSLGIWMIADPSFFTKNMSEAPPAWFGYLFAILGGVFTVSGWIWGAFTIYAGRCIKQRRRRTLSLVMAGLNCTYFPFGTALGVATILVLLRPSVKSEFGEHISSAPRFQEDAPQDRSTDAVVSDVSADEELTWKVMEERAREDSNQDGVRLKFKEKDPKKA